MRGAEWYKGWGSSGTRDLGMILFRNSQVGKPLGYGLMGKEMRVFGIYVGSGPTLHRNSWIRSII